jgi:hypothetical protein
MIEESVADVFPIWMLISAALGFKRQRGILNDIHKHVLAVSKGLEKHHP